MNWINSLTAEYAFRSEHTSLLDMFLRKMLYVDIHGRIARIAHIIDSDDTNSYYEYIR